MRKVIAVGLVFVLNGAAVATQEVDVSLHCLSLRFFATEGKDPQTGKVWGSEIGSASETPLNGELMIMPPEIPFSHGGFLRLTAVTHLEASTIPFAVSIPRFADENRNGLHDFFEISEEVATVTTPGSCITVEGDEVALEAVWHRKAGAKDGTCVLGVPALGLTLQHPFELIQFDGCLVYTHEATTNLVADVVLKQVQAETNRLWGPCPGIVLGPDALHLSSGTWKNRTEESLDYDVFEPLERLTQYYSGYFSFVDGEPATETLDYLDWVLLVTDPWDDDGDGIPDLTDLPDPPSLNLRQTEEGLVFRVTGTKGQEYQFDTATDLEAGDWEESFLVILTSDAQDFEVPKPDGTAKFWRIRVH